MTLQNQRRPAQLRHHRPRRPRQDDARRRHVVADGDLPQRPGRGRAGDGLDGPGEGEGDHDHSPRTRRCSPRCASSSTSSTRPGHADFGGEVERALTMVDGALLLVDASEGPLPQTRFVLRKALELPAADHPRRQQGRPPGRADRRGHRRGLRVVHRPRRGLRADRLPDRLHQRERRVGRRSTQGVEGTDLMPLLNLMLERIPAPTYDEGAPLQAHVTNLDASPYLGRLAVCRDATGDDQKRPADRLVPGRRDR